MNIEDFFVSELIKWSYSNLIDYPWRKFNDPYKSLITEILLRKTNAEKVKNVVEDTLNIIPTIEHLETLPFEMLVLILEPYGMSKVKAEQLKLLAGEISAKYNGHIPYNSKDLLSLHGIGQYICNALLCFSFNKKVPIVDTNVIRLIVRYFGYQSKKTRLRDDKNLWAFVENILPDINYRNFNYALLDYPKLICKANNPLCNNCTFSQYCNHYI